MANEQIIQLGTATPHAADWLAMDNSSTSATFKGTVTNVVAASNYGPALDSVVKDVKHDYGALGDGRQVLDAHMTSGNDTISSATAAFTSADIGKHIVVVGAAAASADLVTTISSITSGTVAVLAANAGASVSGVQAYFGTDDTSAFQSAITAAYAAGKGSRIYVPNGMYFWAGSLQTSDGSSTGTFNAQVTIPNRPAASAAFTIELLGSVPPPACYLQFTNWPAPTSGSIIVGVKTGSGTKPAMIGGPRNDSVTYPNFSSLYVKLQNLTFRTPNNPSLTAVDLEWIGSCSVIDVAVDNGVNTYASIEPSDSVSCGIIFPDVSNNASVFARNVYVQGFYNGIQVSEHFDGDNITLQSCIAAVQAVSAYHECHFHRLMFLQCPQGLIGAGPTPGTAAPANLTIHVDMLDIEQGTSGGPSWMNSGADIDDPNNVLFGSINYHVVAAGVGVTATPNVNGGVNMRLTCEDYPNGLKLYHGGDTIVNGSALTFDSTTQLSPGQWFQNPPAINDAFKSPPFYLAAGVYNLKAVGTTSNANGIQTVELWVDGGSLSLSLGTIDWYSGSSSYNVANQLGPFVIPRSGLYYLKSTVASKNGSSSNYYLGQTYLFLEAA